MQQVGARIQVSNLATRDRESHPKPLVLRGWLLSCFAPVRVKVCRLSGYWKHVICLGISLQLILNYIPISSCGSSYSVHMTYYGSVFSALLDVRLSGANVHISVTTLNYKAVLGSMRKIERDLCELRGSQVISENFYIAIGLRAR